jgi:hypothetical protein
MAYILIMTKRQRNKVGVPEMTKQGEGQVTLERYEVRVWEKAEHWSFDTRIEARDEQDAWRVARKEYPKHGYSIRDVRKIV